MPNPAGPPWWTVALVDFGPQARRYLRAHLPSIRQEHEDLISETSVGVTRLLSSGDQGAWPAAWFGTDSPSEVEVVNRFAALCMKVLKNRVADHFRDIGRRSLEISEPRDEADRQDAEAPEIPLDHQLDLKRTAAALFAAMASLDESDRELLERVGLGDSDAPLSDRERQRLRRLRIELLDRLRSRLGPGVLDSIRRL
jgi:DNA-directed RNA polymerase specialized sigma24 family protein